MTDTLLKSTYTSERDDFKVKSSEIPNSIVNSVTNDEDDWVDSTKNSSRSIVRSVTNDEDEWIEPGDSGPNVPLQPNYPKEFSNRGSMIDDPNHTESTEPSKSSLPVFRPKPFEDNYFEKESFLIRYEQMMMEQKKEQQSTISHLQFFLELLIGLLPDGRDGVYRAHQLVHGDKDDHLLIEFSIEDLRQAQMKLKNSQKYDIVKTDKQFLMVLDILCTDEKHDSGISDHIDTTKTKDRKISWAEIIQCYRNCITGMQTLEKIGANSTIRNRAKERTLALLSGYNKSSFSRYSLSITEPFGTNSLVNAKNTVLDLGTINVSRVGKASPHAERKSRGFIKHAFISFVVGAIVGATLIRGSSSNSQQMVSFTSSLFARQLKDTETSLDARESLNSLGRDFEVLNSSHKSIDGLVTVSQDSIREGQTEGDSRLFNSKSLPKVKGHTIAFKDKAMISGTTSHLPSDPSKINAFDVILSSSREHEGTITAKRPPSLDMKVANIFGGTATILYFLSSSTVSITSFLGFLPTGLGVALAALAVSGKGRWISNMWKKINPKRKKLDAVSN